MAQALYNEERLTLLHACNFALASRDLIDECKSRRTSVSPGDRAMALGVRWPRTPGPRRPSSEHVSASEIHMKEASRLRLLGIYSQPCLRYQLITAAEG